MCAQRRSLLGRGTTALATCALIATACVQATPSESGAAGPPQPASGGRVVVGGFIDASNLNPILWAGAADAALVPRIYDSLLKVDAKTGLAEPHLAEKVETSPDGMTITFTLREGLTWSDGSSLTGEDFRFTVEALMRSKKTFFKSNLQDIVGAQEFGAGKAESISGIAVNGRTITVTLRQPFCPALQRIGGFGIIPKSVFGKYLDAADPSKNADEATENSAPPLASGPFRFREWVPNDHVTLVRNDRFYGGKPRLDEWVYKVYPNSVAIVAALKTGEVDVAEVQPSDKETLQQAGLQGFSYASPFRTQILWNQQRGGKEFFQSKNVRQALAYGLDWDPIISAVYLGEAQKVVAETVPSSWAYDPSGLNEYAYDPARARQLLEQDGWQPGADGVYQRNGQRLAFTLYTVAGNRTNETVQQVIAEQYRQLGIEVTPRVETSEALFQRESASRDPTYGDQGGHDFDAVLITLSTTADPDAYGSWHSSQTLAGGRNYGGYRSPIVDRAVETGRTACTTQDRKTAYSEMNRQLNEDQPENFGVSPKTLLFANRRLHGLDPGPWGSYSSPGYMWNVDQWWVTR